MMILLYQILEEELSLDGCCSKILIVPYSFVLVIGANFVKNIEICNNAVAKILFIGIFLQIFLLKGLRLIKS